jgi:hypothetical protein
VENIYGVGIFIKKTIDILGEGEIKIHENPNYHGRGPTHSRNLQWVECNINNKAQRGFVWVKSSSKSHLHPLN